MSEMPENTPADDALIGRLDLYFSEMEATPVPTRLQHTTLNDLQASHAGIGPWLRTWWTTPGHGGFALAGAAVAMVLVIGIIGVNRGGGDDLSDITSGPSATTGPPDATKLTGPASTTPAPGATDGNTTVPGGTPTGTDPDPSTTVPDPQQPGNVSTIPGVTTSSVPGNVSTPTTVPGWPSTTAKPPASTTPTTAPTTTTPGSVILYQTDFSSTPLFGFPSDFSSVSGTWQAVANGTSSSHFLKNSAPSGTEALAALNIGGGWTNYTVDFTETVADKTTALGGIAFRYQDASNFYFCKMGQQKLYLGIMSGGSFTVLDQATFTFNAGTAKNLHVSAVGSSLSCRVEGGPTLSATNGAFASGRIAAVADGAAAITNILVRSA